MSRGVTQVDRRTVLRVGLFGALAGCAAPAAAETNASGSSSRLHGLSMHGAPALGPDMANFPYVYPAAPKGGRLVLGQLGTFDSLHPFIIKGVIAQGMREWVFESLMARSQDEPFSLYGLIAGAVEVPADRGSITFHLRPEARFSDGRPVTSQDVAFSWRALKDFGWPYHRSYYRKVARLDELGPHTVRMVFDEAGDREMPLIMGLMPVLPAHLWSLETFERTTLEPLVGSGPYTVAKLEPGRSLTFRRNPDHWARGLPVTRGRFNFDEIRVDYFRDGAALLEAFKTGELDVRIEDDPARWSEGYGGLTGRGGSVLKREVPLGLPAGMSALAFNSRRPPFDDRRVRQALIALFDAEWINRNLYDGLYRRTTSYFSRSTLASTGRPADASERRLLQPFPDAVRPDVIEGTWRPPTTDGSGNNRAGLETAHRLLIEAGWVLDGRRFVKKPGGAPLTIEFLASTRAQERLMLAYGRNLERVGIGFKVRQVDSAQYWSRLKSFDFDAVQWTWAASLSPGNEQFNRWSQIAADTPGSLNYAGVRSPAADAMITALLSASDRQEFESAVRALDRVLLSGDYVVPLFHQAEQWIAHWSRITGPVRAPLAGTDFDTWWLA